MAAWTSEEALNKVCIHERRITENGMCAGDKCMGWKPLMTLAPVNDTNGLTKRTIDQNQKTVPSGKGCCWLFHTK